MRGATGTRWIGVDGKGAAGKTTLAEQLAVAIREADPDQPRPVSVVHVDDFARPGLRGWERDRFVDQVLVPLRRGWPGRYQRWDFATDSGAEWLEVPPGGAVIVEGVSATDVRLGVPWDLTLWVEAPADERLRRALLRDGEAMRERWLTDWMPSEDAYEAEQRPQQRVDLIVDQARES